MKTFVFLLMAGLASLQTCNSEIKPVLYAGTYSEANSEGIYRFVYDSGNGLPERAGVTPNQENPSFMALHPGGKYLYAVSEVDRKQCRDSGSVTAYRILKAGRLERINREPTGGNHPCHVSVSPDGKTLLASNYTSGSLSVFRIREDGGLFPLQQLIQHRGQGPDRLRQRGPHVHSARFTPDGQLLLAADLGTDRLEVYVWSADSSAYVPSPAGPVVLPAGYGPRHFDFSPDGRFVYLMNEMGAAVSVLERNGLGFRMVETVSGLPPEYAGLKSGADIHLSPDGRFVYGSNRGHNSIVVYARDGESGCISPIQYEPVRGDCPRNFTLDPEGNFLLVANRRSNNISLFAIDRKTGKLSYTSCSFSLPSPVCLLFLTPQEVLFSFPFSLSPFMKAMGL
ncbi:MAG: lactonase family protein [Mangrovibacterium sp.]